MFVVHEIVSMAGRHSTTGPQIVEQETFPRVIRAELPVYPASLRMADVSGEVSLEIEVRDGVVAAARALSGHLLLAKAAKDNVRTWQFVKGTTSKLHVTYVYALVDRDPAADGGLPRIEVELPKRVCITERRSRW